MTINYFMCIKNNYFITSRNMRICDSKLIYGFDKEKLKKRKITCREKLCAISRNNSDKPSFTSVGDNVD